MPQDHFYEPFFIINRSKLVTETIDGEAIIVHLESGAYFSLRDTASIIWDALQTGSNLSGITTLVNDQFSETPDNLKAEIQTFLADLQADGLVIVGDDPHPLEISPAPKPKQPYKKLVIEKFMDMADLLLLDPIHEVEEDAGWPFKKKSSK